MRASVVVPTTNITRLKILLTSLKSQDLRPWEVVIVAKNIEVRAVENQCSELGLNCIVLEQREGYFTRALNMGKSEASGDIVVFTDDDAIAPRGWLGRYVKLFRQYDKKMACISSRDIYIDLHKLKLLPTPDDKPVVKLYRILIRPILEKPLPIMRKYWCGVYIDRQLEVKHGPCIPNRVCFSLPLRGVNMAFRKEAIDEATFPEHILLKRAVGNEQYVGLQLVLKGWNCVYVPDNPVLHMARESSLSRGKMSKSDYYEKIVMKKMMLSHLSKQI